MQVSEQRKTWSLIAVATAAAITMSGCSSSSSKQGSTTPTESSAATGAATTDPAAGGAAAETDAAKAAVAPFLTTPTKINQSVPLTGKIPTGKLWVIITCELPQCHVISDGALAAAKAAGVPTKLLSYKTTDGTTLTSAMKQALDAKPFAVSPVGFAQAVWDSLQPQYKAANVIITSMATGDSKPSDIVTEGSASQFDYTAGGKTMADYVIADSAASAHILVQDVPAFAVLKTYGDGFKGEIAKGCSACKVTNLDIAPAQLSTNSVVPGIIAALHKDPSIKYLASTDGAFLIGISAALKAAGINDIKIIGGSPDINNLTAVKNGTQTAWTGAAEDEYGWVALDIIARKVLGMEIPPGDGGRVTEVLTHDNIGTPSPSGLGAPADFADQYKKLWGLS